MPIRCAASTLILAASSLLPATVHASPLSA
jgi:hypothetical protein